MAKNAKPSKVEVRVRKRVADLEKALDDATGRLKKARKDADKARADAEKAIRKATKSAQRQIAESADAARAEIDRFRGSLRGAGGGDGASASSTATTPAPAAKKTTARKAPAKKTTARKAPAKKTTANKTTVGSGGSYASMTVAELRKAAQTKGVKGYSRMSKSELVSRLGG